MRIYLIPGITLLASPYLKGGTGHYFKGILFSDG